MRTVLKLTLTALLGLALAPGWLWGQANMTGSIVGQVADQSGAVVAGAQVTLTAVATSTEQHQPTNHAGRFAFLSLPVGTYDVSVTKEGFRVLSVAGQAVTLSQTLTLNLTLEVGATTQTVEVTGTPGAELQTLSSTMGSSLNNTTMLDLPSLNRDVSALLNLQPTAAPTFHGTIGDVTGGSIAGATPDQNTFMLDGSNNTSGLEGDNGYINNFSGDQRGVVPTPIETIGEVTVNTNNSTADFNTSTGGELLATTKSGTDQFHGAAYDFFQGDWLDSNSWSNNFSGVPKPKSHQNRYGFDVGGPMLPKHVLGGGTYFFVNYEAQRYPFNTTGEFNRSVPSAALRQGIITIPTSEGNQTFDLSQPLNICGATGGLPCDPRNAGMSSAVSTIWQKYMPLPNYTQGGQPACVPGASNCDGYNSFTFRNGLTLPLENDEWTGRIDHDFGSKNRWTSTYRWFKQNIPTTNETDIGGLLAGDTSGKIASASSNRNQPFVFNTGLTTTITPSLTNTFHFGYTRNEWNWIRNGPQTPAVPGSAGAIEIDGESTNALIPVNIDTQNSRNRAWYEHNYDYRDELTWLKGNHMFQFGGDMLHEWWHFNRFDNVVGGLTNLIYEIDNGSVNMTPDFQPRPCGGGVTTQCLDPGNATELNKWNKYYADVLGIVNHSSLVATRSGANLQLNPPGTPAASYVTVNTPSFYINDSWKVRPSLTVNLGLNYMVQLPPYDLNGRQDVLVDGDNNPMTYASFIRQRQEAAENGQVYAPIEGFSPVGALGLKYPFHTYYGQFGPRISMAWSPSFDNGLLATLFGHKSTVIRGGWGRFYSRDLGINVVSNPVLGDGFLQPVSCVPTMSGGCTSVRGVDPSNAFRMGTNADGLNVPLPPLTPTLSSPVQPGIGTTPSAELTDSMDQNFRPNRTDQVDFSIQRQLKNNMIVEVGYVGVFGSDLFQGIEMNAVPWMTKLGGQTFAQAYAALWTQLYKGTATNAVSPQPFFETGLGGTKSSFCGGYTSCTAALAANAEPYITTEDVTDTWSLMETSGSWTLPMALYTDTGQSSGYGPYANTSTGISNYQALVMKFTERTSHGLMLQANATYGHALGTLGLAQTYTLDAPDNVFNLNSDWTPQPWDRKFTMNVLGAYALPFGTGQRWSSSNGVISRLISGWSVSPIFTFGSGLPLEIYTGQPFGGGNMGVGYYDENGASAVPVNINTASLSNSHNQGVEVSTGGDNPNSVGVNGNAGGSTGTAANMFKDPLAVYNSFRPFVLGIDGSPSPDGNLRGPVEWNLDFGINKDTKITERVGFSLYGHFFNVLNHNNWNAPYLDLSDGPDFGVMTGGAGNIGNYTRVIELGARVYF